MYPQTQQGKGWLIAEMPETETPRARINERVESASNTELLAELIGSGTRGKSCIDIARGLINAYHGSLSAIATATSSELGKAHGIGPARAARIRAALNLAQRVSMEARETTSRIHTPVAVAESMREVFRGKMQEEFHVLLLDTKHALIRDQCVTVGLVDRSQIHAREVFRSAIREACSRVLMVHNHPSGDPTPSDQDIKCTKALVAAGEIIGIEVLDHVIVGNANANQSGRWFMSFREDGMLTKGA